jgi:predicted transcriptional regulator
VEDPEMKKTSIYLDDEHVARLKRLAEAEGRAQADIVRDAITMYESTTRRPRKFAMDGVACGPGGSIADIPDEELMKGFGEK